MSDAPQENSQPDISRSQVLLCAPCMGIAIMCTVVLTVCNALLQEESWPEIARRQFLLLEVAAMVKALDSSGGLGPAVGAPGVFSVLATTFLQHIRQSQSARAQSARAQCICTGASA